MTNNLHKQLTPEQAQNSTGDSKQQQSYFTIRRVNGHDILKFRKSDILKIDLQLLKKATEDIRVSQIYLECCQNSSYVTRILKEIVTNSIVLKDGFELIHNIMLSQIVNMNFLDGIIWLQQIILLDCKSLNNIDQLDQCQNLRIIKITNSKLRHVNAFLQIRSLSNVYLKNNEYLTDLNGLKNSVYMTKLYILNSPIQSVDFMSDYQQIKCIEIYQCRLLKNFKGFPQLQILEYFKYNSNKCGYVLYKNYWDDYKFQQKNEISVKNITDLAILNLVLKALTIENMKLLDYQANYRELFKICQLDVQNEEQTDNNEKAFNLRTLVINISDKSSVKYQYQKYLNEFNQYLNSMQFENIYNIQRFDYLIEYFNVQFIKFQGCKQIDLKYLKQIRRLQSIKIEDINGGSILFNKQVQCRCQQNGSYLKVKGKVYKSLILHFIKQYQIIYFNASNCGQITQDILEQMTELSQLYIFNCAQIKSFDFKPKLIQLKELIFVQKEQQITYQQEFQLLTCTQWRNFDLLNPFINLKSIQCLKLVKCSQRNVETFVNAMQVKNVRFIQCKKNIDLSQLIDVDKYKTILIQNKEKEKITFSNTQEHYPISKVEIKNTKDIQYLKIVQNFKNIETLQINKCQMDTLLFDANLFTLKTVIIQKCKKQLNLDMLSMLKFLVSIYFEQLDLQLLTFTLKTAKKILLNVLSIDKCTNIKHAEQFLLFFDVKQCFIINSEKIDLCIFKETKKLEMISLTNVQYVTNFSFLKSQTNLSKLVLNATNFPNISNDSIEIGRPAHRFAGFWLEDLNQQHQTQITLCQLKQIKEIVFENQSTIDIKYLKCFPQIKRLKISQCSKLTNIQYLSQLNIEYLVLSRVDLSSLVENLQQNFVNPKQINTLQLNECHMEQINDFPYTLFEDSEYRKYINNQIQQTKFIFHDIGVLSQLSLSGCNLADQIQWQQNISIKQISFDNMDITSLHNIQLNRELKQVTVTNCPNLRDITTLLYCNLSSVKINQTGIGDISSLLNQKQLYTLDTSDNTRLDQQYIVKIENNRENVQRLLEQLKTRLNYKKFKQNSWLLSLNRSKLAIMMNSFYQAKQQQVNNMYVLAVEIMKKMVLLLG